MSEHGCVSGGIGSPPPPEVRWTSDDYLAAAADTLTSAELRERARELVAQARRHLTRAERLAADMHDAAARLDGHNRGTGIRRDP
jgi:hypothetical protein